MERPRRARTSCPAFATSLDVHDEARAVNRRHSGHEVEAASRAIHTASCVQSHQIALDHVTVHELLHRRQRRDRERPRPASRVPFGNTTVGARRRTRQTSSVNARPVACGVLPGGSLPRCVRGTQRSQPHKGPQRRQLNSANRRRILQNHHPWFPRGALGV